MAPDRERRVDGPSRRRARDRPMIDGWTLTRRPRPRKRMQVAPEVVVAAGGSSSLCCRYASVAWLPMPPRRRHPRTHSVTHTREPGHRRRTSRIISTHHLFPPPTQPDADGASKGPPPIPRRAGRDRRVRVPASEQARRSRRGVGARATRQPPASSVVAAVLRSGRPCDGRTARDVALRGGQVRPRISRAEA